MHVCTFKSLGVPKNSKMYIYVHINIPTISAFIYIKICVSCGVVCIGSVTLFSHTLRVRVTLEEPSSPTYAMNLCEGRLDGV